MGGMRAGGGIRAIGPTGLRVALLAVIAANLGYFAVEWGVAQGIGSVSLFADSIDFLEDAFLNVLIVAALGWQARNRARLGMVLACVLLVPGGAALLTAWQKFLVPVPPDAALLSVTGAGALAVNLGCAMLLARYRDHQGSLTRAAFLSARNDAIANVAIIGAGLVSMAWVSAVPDLVVGLGIAAMNAEGARDVWRAARRERDAAGS